MKKEEHMKKAVELTGKPYEEVHIWLDEMFKWFGGQHRRIRHNKNGVDYIKKKYGKEAAKVARQHLLDDGIYLPPEEDDAEIG